MRASTKNRFRPGSALLLAGLLLLAGCAVLTIDVDVYKGPLANHEWIQTEQVAGMAMGAKAILVNLRDTAACGWDKETARKLRKEPWYKLAFIPPNEAGTWRFTNELALQANMILSLYEDRNGGDVNALLEEAHLAVKKGLDAYAILHRSTDDDIKFFESLKFTNEVNLPANASHNPGTNTAPATAKMALTRAYECFLVQSNLPDKGNWREVTNIFQVPEALDHSEGIKDLFNGNLANVDQNQANACFYALKDRGWVEHHAEILFPYGGEAMNKIDARRQSFVDEVTKIATSFTDSQEAIMELWRLDLGILISLDRATNRIPPGTEHIAIESRAGSDLKARDLRVNRAASLAAQLVDPVHLMIMLRAVQWGTNVPDGIKELRSSIQTNGFGSGIDYIDKLTLDQVCSNDMKVANDLRAALQKTIQREPAKTAMALAEADNYFIRDEWVAIGTNKDTKFVDQSFSLAVERCVGLARGPGHATNAPGPPPNQWENDFSGIQIDMSQISVVVAGLGHGRISDGLQTLIENYRQASHDLPKENVMVSKTRMQLLDELVVFAEKVKFIADSQALVSRRSGAEDWLTYTGDIASYPLSWPASGFPIRADQGMNKTVFRRHGQIFDQTDDYERARPYTLVLQAIGNSIISLVNEIVEHEAYTKESKQVIDPEWNSLTNALRYLASQINTNVTSTPHGTNFTLEITGTVAYLTNSTSSTVLDAKMSSTNDGTLTGTLFGIINCTTNDTITANIMDATNQNPIGIIKVVRKDLTNNAFTGTLTVAVAGARNGVVIDTQSNKTLGVVSINVVKSTNSPGTLTAKLGTNSNPDMSNLFDGLEQPKTKLQGSDILINSLRNLQISATLAGDTTLATHAAAAIDMAMSNRTDNIYIRPPSAYLRNSYPATSLQPNANLSWKNMLDREAWRSMPLIGETIANWGMDINTIQDIDKQYWQNINRVKVASAGISSYAIMKDDIGNWTVKTYTGDPSPIIDGAKSMALYGLSTSTIAKGAQALTPTATSSNAVSQPSLLQSQYDHFSTNYLQETTNEGWTVYSTVTNLSNIVINALVTASNSPATNAASPANTNIVATQATNMIVNLVTNQLITSKTNAIDAGGTNVTSITNQVFSLSTNAVVAPITNAAPNAPVGSGTNDFSIASNSVIKYYNLYLTNALVKLRGSLDAKSPQPDVLGKQITDVLWGVQRFQETAYPNIGVNYKAASAKASNMISAQLTELVRTRLQTVKNYESAMKVLSESVSK